MECTGNDFLPFPSHLSLSLPLPLPPPLFLSLYFFPVWFFATLYTRTRISEVTCALADGLPLFVFFFLGSWLLPRFWARMPSTGVQAVLVPMVKLMPVLLGAALLLEHAHDGRQANNRHECCCCCCTCIRICPSAPDFWVGERKHIASGSLTTLPRLATSEKLEEKLQL